MGERVTDGLQTFLGGRTQAVDAMLLDAAQYVEGINISSRGGLVHTRPSFAIHSTVTANLPAITKFQGAALYHLSGDTDRVVFGADGHVYSIRFDTLAVTDHGELLSATVDRFYFCQAERYMIVQDGDPLTSWANANWPVILHEDTRIDQSDSGDATYYIADEDKRLPKGGPMAYGHGRLFVAVNYVYFGGQWSSDLGRVGFVAGDLVLPYEIQSLLEFADVGYSLTGGRIKLPIEIGYIHAMTIQQNQMTGIGQGPLIVMGDNGISAFQINADATVWGDMDLGAVLFRGPGCRSPHSLVHRNADMFYRSTDGIRSLQAAVREKQADALTNESLAAEIADLLNYDTFATLPLVSAACVNNRLFMTVKPESGVFKGLAVLDLLPVNSVRGQLAPVWDGVWQGLDFHQILSVEWEDAEVLCGFCKDESGTTKFFYLSETQYNDNGNTSPQVCRLYTGYKTFKYVWSPKTLQYLDLWVSDLKGDVEITAYYKTDRHPLWVQMTSGTVSSGTGGLNQQRSNVRLTVDAVVADEIMDRSLRHGWALQFCIQWTGHMKLDRAYVTADAEKEHPSIILSGRSETGEDLEANSDAVELDDYEYRIV